MRLSPREMFAVKRRDRRAADLAAARTRIEELEAEVAPRLALRPDLHRAALGALDENPAIAELRANVGSQLDSRVVETLVSSLGGRRQPGVAAV